MGTTQGTVLALAVACLLGASGSAALASPARPPYGAPASLTEAVTSAHFVVHYTTAAGDPNAIAASAASTLDQQAEAAYAREVGDWGFPAPKDDGDGRTDVYVYHDPSMPTAALTHPDTPEGDRNTDTAWISIPPPANAGEWLIGHEFFHVLQFARYIYWGWLTESSAMWAHLNIYGTGVHPGLFDHPWVSLECYHPGPNSDCGGDGYGYGDWVFLEYLAERDGGPSFVNYIGAWLAFWGPQSVTAPTDALRDALSNYDGSTIAQAFDGFVTQSLAQRWTLGGIAGSLPAVDATVDTGSAPAAQPDRGVAVDHLSARYLRFAASGGAPCVPERLHLAVDVPAAAATQPVVVGYAEPSTAIAMPVSGGVASADLPWSSCAGATAELGLPNASTSADGLGFTVHARTELAPGAATGAPTPLPSPAHGSTNALAESQAAPAVRLLRVRRARRGLALRVLSTGPGKLAVALRSPHAHHTFRLAPGVNRLTLQLHRRLHRGRRHLVLKPRSPSGATGRRIARTIAVR